MIRPVMSRALTAAALSAAFLSRSAIAADLPDSPKLLPPTVFAYASVPDVAELKDRVGESNLGAMLRDPKLQPFFDQWKDAIGQAGDQVQKNLGVSLQDLEHIPSGTITLAVVQLDRPGQIGVVMMMDYGDNGETLDKLIEKAEAGLEDRGGKRIEEQVEGTEVVIYESPSKAGGDDLDSLDEDDNTKSEPTRVAYFRKDDRIVIGNSVPTLEAVLARWDGGNAKTFANDATFQYISEKTRTDDREPVMTWFVNPLGAVQAGISSAENPPPQAQMAMAFLPTLGVTKLKAMGGSLDVSTDEFDSVAKMYMYVDQPATGVFGLFKFPAADLAPPSWVTSAATGYFTANWDLAAAYNATRSLVDMFRGPGSLDQLVKDAAQQGPQVNVKTDVIDQMNGRIHVLSFPISQTDLDSGEAVQQPTLLAFGVKNEQKMNDLLAKLAKTPNFPGETRQFQGITVYDLPLGATGSTASIAVAQGNLFFSTESRKLEDILRKRGGEPLAETAEFKKLAGHFPADTSMMAYSNQRDQMRTIYEQLRSGKASENFSPPFDQIDMTKLPPFEDVQQYLMASGSYAVPDEHGAMFVSFGLKAVK